MDVAQVHGAVDGRADHLGWDDASRGEGGDADTTLIVRHLTPAQGVIICRRELKYGWVRVMVRVKLRVRASRILTCGIQIAVALWLGLRF